MTVRTMADPGVTPKGTLPRYVVLKVWGHDPAVDRVAEALDAAGIQATVSCARRTEPRHQPHGMPFEPRLTVNFAEPEPEPTVTVEIPRKAAETLQHAINSPYMPSAEDRRHAREAISEACKEALRETHTEAAPVLRVGAKVKRTGFTDPDVGRFGIGTVVRVLPGSNRAEVCGPNGVRSWWGAENFEVVG